MTAFVIALIATAGVLIGVVIVLECRIDELERRVTDTRFDLWTLIEALVERGIELHAVFPELIEDAGRMRLDYPKGRHRV